jgi:chromosomal replication initiation ATPase DnaA
MQQLFEVVNGKKYVIKEEGKKYLMENYGKKYYTDMGAHFGVSVFKVLKWMDELKLTPNSRWKTPAFEINEAQLEKIAVIVSEVTGISVEAIKGQSRKRDIVIARQLYCFFSFGYTKNSMTSIGEFISDRDHTTVGWVVQTIKDLVDTNHANVRELFMKCKAEVKEYYKPVERSGLRKVFANLSKKVA